MARIVLGLLETVEDIRLLRKLDKNESQAYKFNNIIGRSVEMEKLFNAFTIPPAINA